MSRVKAWLRAFFGLSRGEINGFLILLPLILVIVFVIPLYQQWSASRTQDFSKEIHELDSLTALWKWDEPKDSTVRERILFHFNPNTVTKEELNQLGFSNFLAQRIINYRTKGGKFFIKADVRKIYGMDTMLFQKLYSFINLPIERTFAKKEDEKGKESKSFIAKKKEKFDLNLADSTQLISVFGIGAKLSVRIIKYRDKLGGFVHPDQLKEVFGLDTLVISELKKVSFITEDFAPRFVLVNKATEKELAAHPYIKYALAKAIASYRFQHGEFKSVEDIKKIALVDESLFQKIKPYISINP